MLAPGVIPPIDGVLPLDIPAEPVVLTKPLDTGGIMVLTLLTPNAGAPLDCLPIVGSDPSPTEL